jgi:thioredoxin 1
MVLEEEGTSRVGIITRNEDYESEVECGKSGYVLVDFFAEWCGPCKRFYPTLCKLSTQFPNVKFFKVDVEELEDKSEDANVKAMPTFILFNNGQQVGRVTGADEIKLITLLNQAK